MKVEARPRCGHGAVHCCSSVPERVRLTRGVHSEPQVFCTVQSLHRSITNVSGTIKRIKRIFKHSGSALLLMRLPAFSRRGGGQGSGVEQGLRGSHTVTFRGVL